MWPWSFVCPCTCCSTQRASSQIPHQTQQTQWTWEQWSSNYTFTTTSSTNTDNIPANIDSSGSIEGSISEQGSSSSVSNDSGGAAGLWRCEFCGLQSEGFELALDGGDGDGSTYSDVSVDSYTDVDMDENVCVELGRLVLRPATW